MPRSLRGVLPVFQTPYHDDESIDFETLAREFDWLIAEGADGVVMAMVSEVLRLSTSERFDIAAETLKIVNGRISTVISVGSETIRLAREFAIHAAEHGATAVMAIPPIAAALPEDELARYYSAILDAIPIPVVVQDASGYVGRPMSIELQARMLDRYGDRVLFKPEAVPIGPRLSALRDATGGRAQIFEGSGGIALVDSYRRGVVGTMPAADLIEVLVALWKALEAGDQPRIERLSLPLGAMIALQTNLDAYLAIEKYILHKRGIFKNTIVRGPVAYRLDEETRREVDRLYDMLMRALHENS